MTNHEGSDFSKVVEDIRSAEQEHDRVLSNAKQEASNIVLKAKETILSEHMKSESAITAFKNDQIKKGSAEIEASVKDLIDKAKASASKLSAKKLDKAAVTKMAQEFLESI